MTEWIGKTVGRVRIEKEIAKGGMAEVYLGTHLTLDRAVAVKVMHNYIEIDPGLQARFEREAKVVAGLRHPNIVQIFDFDTSEGHPYIVMEYLKGPSLAAYLRELQHRNQRLQPAQIARLLVIIATALDYAHEKGVIHRDIKPANILLHNKTDDFSIDQPITERTEPVISDFGLVRIVQAATQTASGSVSGTPAYMSPEQAQGLKVDRRSDIYSLGVVLYEMVAGRVPFEADTSWTLIFKHINEPPPPIANARPAVQKVIDRALAKKPEDRYQTAGQLAADYLDAVEMAGDARTLRTSLPPANPAAAVSVRAKRASGLAWTRIALFLSIGVLVAGLALFGVLRLSSMRGISSLTPSNGNGPIDTIPSVGLLRFQDGTAPADTVTLSTTAMPPPPQGTQYQAWLVEDDGEQRISIGIITFDKDNKGSLTFVDNDGSNLLGKYSAMEITVEPDPDTNPNSSNKVAFSVRLPQGGLTHVRHLLYAFSATPNQIGFLRGLDADTDLLTQSAKQMLSSFESEDQASALVQAESMLNLIVGGQSKDHKDWNGDGSVEDPGDGYGLLLNGDNLGYIQGSYTHADLAISSPDATQNMRIHGEHVKICATNISNWTAQLHDQLIKILENPSNADQEGLIRQAVAIANQIRAGVDVNGDEKIEPIPGEGGALTAYEHAYYMADMLIVPAGSTPSTP